MKRLIVGLTAIALVLGIGMVFAKFVYFAPPRSTGIKAIQPSGQGERELLEVKKDRLTLQRNLKQREYIALLKDAPCGAKTQEMTILHNEISAIDQKIIEIEGQLRAGNSGE